MFGRKFSSNIRIKKRMIISSIILLVVFLGMGYSVFTTNLGINGTISVSRYIPIASEIGYDNTNTGINCDNTQCALDYLYAHPLEINTNNTSYPFNVGDYVTLVPDSSSYTISTSATGYSSSQTINPSELTLWRIIKKYGDGSMDAVSEYTSSTNVAFTGTTGYRNFVGTLQTIAAQYSKAGYTKSVRMMGYDGQTLTVANNSSAFSGSSPAATTSTGTPKTGMGSERSNGLLGDTLYLKDYQLVSNVYLDDTTTYGTYGLISYVVNDTSTAKEYWVASRLYSYYTTPRTWGFSGRYISTSGDLYGKYLRGFNNGASQNVWSDSTVEYALRPIITLKSGVTIANGSGLKSNPYILN